MTLIKSGIENVMAFELPNGIWGDGGHVGCPRVALVEWRSCWSEMFYQIYVNGQYAGTTVDSQQRRMIVQVPTSLESPVRIEVFAVEEEQATADFRDEIEPQIGRARIVLLRSQKLPIGATAKIYFDNGTGEIDYNTPLNNSPIRAWPVWQDKAGFGISRFGASDFGYDSAAAVGFGRGSFGNGQFGLDADTFEWISPPFKTGTYKFAVRVTDGLGNESNGDEIGQVTLTPAAKPVEQVSICSFDEQTNRLVLSIS